MSASNLDMPTHLTHRLCDGGTVEGRWRTVISRPDDNHWPVDAYIRVPYCTVCKRCVSVTECDDERIPQ